MIWHLCISVYFLHILVATQTLPAGIHTHADMHTYTCMTHPLENKHILFNKGLTTALHPVVLVRYLIL